MRCYRVDEDVFEGIPLSRHNNDLCIEVGDERVVLNPSLTGQLCESKHRVMQTLESAFTTGTYEGAYLSTDDKSRVGQLLEDLEGQSTQLIYADVDPEGTVTCEVKRRPDALVLVETSAGINGRISFMSVTYDECFDARSNRVRRKYRRIFPPPGVTILKEGKTPQGGNCYLLHMVPSSSFRIERSGALEGEPSILTVVWKGRKGPGGLPLLMFSPDRRQE